MTTHKQHIILLAAAAALSAILFSSCNGNDDVKPNTASPIYMLPLTGSYSDHLYGDTRALPSGFSVYDPEEVTNIDIFLTSDTEEGKRGTFSNQTGKWRSDVGVENGQMFFVHGFLPKEAATGASIAPLNGSAADGAVMTLMGLSPLSITDVCVVVGVKQGETAGLSITEADGIRMGQFAYRGRSAQEGNFIYLLLHHIYASLGFQFRVDATYNMMRTIVLKKMWLSTTSASSTTATITIRANNSGDDPIQSVAWESVAGEKEVTLFDEPDGQVLTTVFADLQHCVFANLINGDVTMHCIYDVYDKSGNLTRANCVTENKLPPLTIVGHGERTVLRLTVNPTYLYVLSDADLDNPSLTIE